MAVDLDTQQRAPVADGKPMAPRAVAAEPGAPVASSAPRTADDVPVIGEIRTRAVAIAREEVARTMRRLAADDDLAARLDAMAGSIVSKLLLEPSVRLRRAASEGGAGEAIVAAAREMFLADGAPRRRDHP